MLRDGELVTVDGTSGVVREGDSREPAAIAAGAPAAIPAVPAVVGPSPASPEATGTLLYVNLAIADHAEEVAAQPVPRAREAIARAERRLLLDQARRAGAAG